MIKKIAATVIIKEVIMKKSLLFLFCIICTVFANGQRNYTEAIQQGDDAFNKGQYKMAINKYFAAEAFDPSKKEIVKEKVNKVFDMIESLRKKAVESEKIAIQAKKETEDALAKANKLIKAFYFYDDKFALTLGGDDYDYSYYFINKNGDKIEKLGNWVKAEPFEILTGFARVRRGEEAAFLLDTIGNIYPVAYDIAGMKEEITALDLSDVKLDSFPTKVFEYDQLKILLLNKFTFFEKPKNITVLPDEITKLKNLEYLDLQYCNMNSVPAQIGELKKLRGLNLWNNKLKSIPAQIGELRNLTLLFLGNNEVDTIPAQIFGLKNLKMLVLDETNLKNLPPEIGHMKNLTWLFLDHNQLSILPPQLYELKNLNRLGLNANNLTSLSPRIGDLKELTYLDLADNQLTTLPMQISKLKNLRTLDLALNPIPESEKEKIKKLLPNCKIEF